MRRLFSFFGAVVILHLCWFGFAISADLKLDKSQIKQSIDPIQKIQLTPLEQSDSKGLCELIFTNPPLLCVENWIETGHSYASYQDPAEAGCIPPYPFQVLEAHFSLCALAPVVTEIYVDILEANLDDPSCPYPSQTIFASRTYPLEILVPGDYEVVVLLEEKVCVNGPYFVGFNFPEPVTGLGLMTYDNHYGCRDYMWSGSDPQDLVSQLGFPGNIILYSVGLTADANLCGEYPSPIPEIIQPREPAWYDQTYFSDSLRITVDDVSEGSRIDHVKFEYMDPMGIWHPIGTDYDGTDIWYNSWDSAQVGGDGWSYVWVADGLDEGTYFIRATMVDSMGREATDIINIYHDPLPPIPIITRPESTGVYCSPIEVLFTLQADHIAEMEVTVYNWSLGWPTESKEGEDTTYDKGIPSMRQDTLYYWGKNIRGQKVNAGCVPTAAAACLTWWAGHGYPGITGGVGAKDLVDSLASKDYFKTSPSTGTKSSKLTTGMDRWLTRKLGFCVFKYPLYENNPRKMTFDLYAREIKREDIIVGWGGQPWHATTGNSATAQSSTYDVMDPGTGQTTTYTWPRGAGNTKINQIWIISPKVQPQPPPGTPGPPPMKYQDSEDQYRIAWMPDTTQTPYHRWYTLEVTVTDSLGHVGRDMFHFELDDYVCGDANSDGMTNLGDLIYDLNYLFKNGEPPDRFESGDANCDDLIDMSDAIFLINYLFKDGPYPGCF
jgi:hypothetical protein